LYYSKGTWSKQEYASESSTCDARDIGASGYKEVILTGIHLGAYGADLHPPTTLVQLLTHIEEQRPVPRVRLSSIEPNEITEELMHLIAVPKFFVPTSTYLSKAEIPAFSSE